MRDTRILAVAAENHCRLAAKRGCQRGVQVAQCHRGWPLWHPPLATTCPGAKTTAV